MTLSSEIICVLLAAILALQGWILREIIRLKVRVAIIMANCPRCIAESRRQKDEDEFEERLP